MREEKITILLRRGTECAGRCFHEEGNCIASWSKTKQHLKGGRRRRTLQKKLPDRAPFSRIQFTPNRAMPVFSKFLNIAERSIDPKSCRRVSACHDTQFECLWTIFAAPYIGSWEPKELLCCVREGRKWFLFSKTHHPLLVGKISFLDASIVSNVLSLSVDAIQLWKELIKSGPMKY